MPVPLASTLSSINSNYGSNGRLVDYFGPVKGRRLWVKEVKSKRHVGFAEYKAVVLELSEKAHDSSNKTLTAEAKLLRVQHHYWMVERQRDITTGVHQGLIEYRFQVEIPELKLFSYPTFVIPAIKFEILVGAQ
jgi:hypothetical protein